MSPFFQDTEVDHEGAVEEDVTADQFGSPERLQLLTHGQLVVHKCISYDIEVTAHPRCAAALQMRLPGAHVSLNNPFRASS
jgi:hypothetical protein